MQCKECVRYYFINYKLLLKMLCDQILEGILYLQIWGRSTLEWTEPSRKKGASIWRGARRLKVRNQALPCGTVYVPIRPLPPLHLSHRERIETKILYNILLFHTLPVSTCLLLYAPSGYRCRRGRGCIGTRAWVLFNIPTMTRKTMPRLVSFLSSLSRHDKITMRESLGY